MHKLMHRLLVGGEVVPEHSCVLEIGLRVSFLGVDKDWEVGGITDEEDGSVVEDPVPVTLLGIELHSKPSGVSSRICGTLLAANSGKSNSQRSLLADTSEHVDGGDVTYIVRDFKLSVSSSAFGMDNTLRDTFAIEMGEQVYHVKVLEQQRTHVSHALPRRGVLNGTAIGGGVRRLLVVLERRRLGLISVHHD